MKPIPTAEEFCNQYLGFEQYGTDVPYFMIEFAKLHCEAQAKEAIKVLDVNGDGDYIEHPTSERILNAYPLSNIK